MSALDDFIVAFKEAVPALTLALIGVLKQQKDVAEAQASIAKEQLKELEDRDAIESAHSGESPRTTIDNFLRPK